MCTCLYPFARYFRIGAIHALEENLRRPVLTANQVALWEALRVMGTTSKVIHYGSVFTNPAGRLADCRLGFIQVLAWGRTAVWIRIDEPTATLPPPLMSPTAMECS
jgi:hypothetical protein